MTAVKTLVNPPIGPVGIILISVGTLVVAGIIVFVVVSTKPCPDGEIRQKIGDCYTCATICKDQYGMPTQHYPIEGKKCEHTECLLCPPGQTYQTAVPGDYTSKGICVDDCPKDKTRCVPERNYDNVTNIPGLNSELNLTNPGEGVFCSDDETNCVFSEGLAQSCIHKDSACGPIKYNKGNDKGKDIGVMSQCCGEGKFQEFPKCNKNEFGPDTDYRPEIDETQFPTIYSTDGNKCDFTKDLSGNTINYKYPPEPTSDQLSNFCMVDTSSPSPSGWCWTGTEKEECDLSNPENKSRTNFGWCYGCLDNEVICRLETGRNVCCPSEKCVNDRGGGRVCCDSKDSEVLPEYDDNTITDKMVCCPLESIVNVKQDTLQATITTTTNTVKACCPLNAPIAKDGACHFKCGDTSCKSDINDPMACVEINGKKSCISSQCVDKVSNVCPPGESPGECPSEAFSPNSPEFKPTSGNELSGHCFDYTDMKIIPELQGDTEVNTFDLCRKKSEGLITLGVNQLPKPNVYCGKNLEADYVRDYSMNIKATDALQKIVNNNNNGLTIQDYLEQSCIQFGLNTPAGSGEGGKTTYTKTGNDSGTCTVELPCDINIDCTDHPLTSSIQDWYNTNKSPINVKQNEPSDYTPYLDIDGSVSSSKIPSIVKVDNGTGYVCSLQNKDQGTWEAVSVDNSNCLPLIEENYNKIKTDQTFAACANTLQSQSKESGTYFFDSPYFNVDSDGQSYQCETSSCTRLSQLGGTAHCTTEPCIGNQNCDGCTYGQFYDNNQSKCRDCPSGDYNSANSEGYAIDSTCQPCYTNGSNKYVDNTNNNQVCNTCPPITKAKSFCTGPEDQCCPYPSACIPGQTWSPTGYEPCNQCTQCKGSNVTVGKACTKTSDTTCINHCEGSERYKDCDAGNDGHTGPAGNCGSRWATNGKCEPRPGNCSANFVPGCLDGSGVVLDKCPGHKCGVSDAEQDSIWAGEGTKCMDQGYSCGEHVGFTCINGAWMKNCPPGWSCDSSDIHRNDQCWDNGLQQIMTCKQCGANWPCVSNGEWVWGGPGDDYCTGGGCENVKSNPGPCK